MCNLANTALLLELERRNPMASTKISCICLFIIWGFKLACVRLLPLTLCYIMNTSWCSCIWGISQTGFYFLCRLLLGYLKLKNFWRNDFSRLVESFLNGPLLWVYNKRQGLEMYALHLGVILMYSSFGTWWHTVTHGRGNEGETGEWSG